MKKYFLILFFNSLFAAENFEAIDIAKPSYGAKSSSKNIIDNDKITAEDITTFTVKFPAMAKLNEIELKFVPANGKIIFKAIKGNEQVTLCQVNITEKDVGIKIPTDKDDEYLEIQVEWIPKIPNQKLTVREFSAITLDKQTIFLYKEIANTIQNNLFNNKNSEAAGSQTSVETTSTNNTKTVSAQLPTEFTISNASLTSGGK